MIQRILSAIVAIVYMVVAYKSQGLGGAIKGALFLVLPMACVWFGDELGGYVGVMRGQAITKETPGCLVRLGGWLVLLLPLAIRAVMLIKGK